MKAPVVLLPLLLAAACARSDPAILTADAPEGWTVVAAPALGSEAASCANWAVGSAWAVTLDADSARPLIRPFRRQWRADTIAVPGGRLTSEDLGEFGGTVWWEPVAGGRTRVAETNLVVFIPTDAGVLGLTGLAHLTLNEGHLVRFAPQPDNGWAMERILDLGAAPNAYAVLPDDTLLVATSGTLIAARPPAAAVHVLHRNEVWRYTYPNSVVRSRSGVVYLGMRSAVARLRPSGGRYVEEWLVPASCAKRRRVNDMGECECVAPTLSGRPGQRAD